MNKELAEFCGICWHDEVSETGRCTKCDLCLCIPQGSCITPACMYPDFAGKDFHLLHTAMSEKGRWYDLYLWLYSGQAVSGTTPIYCGNHFHQLQFPKQAKLIYEFVRGAKDEHE